MRAGVLGSTLCSSDASETSVEETASTESETPANPSKTEEATSSSNIFGENEEAQQETKSKPVKKVTELQRVKAQIKRDKLNPRLKVKAKGNPTGSVVRNYRGKPEPTYSTSKKYKPYVPPKKP